MRGNSEKALDMRIYAKPQRNSPVCSNTIPLITFMNLTLWQKKALFVRRVSDYCLLRQ